MVDLADHDQRDAVAARLGEVFAGRRVILGPGVLAGYTRTVRWLRALDARVLAVSTTRGAGPVPGPDECDVVGIVPPATTSVTDEFRMLDRMTRSLPPRAVAAIDAFDPEREAVWWCGPFVTSDEPVLGRPVYGGRPRSFLALEDKLLAEDVWAAADVAAAPHRVVPLDDAELAAASARLAGELGVVWSGDARDGFNGGGNYVRWVRDEGDRRAALGFFLPRCDRVRVMPFLDGVPCSIHGFVMPGGTAVLRPVEIATLRDPGRRRLVYGGLSSWWDPPATDREEMRGIARRVGERLRAAYGYRGAFGIDGVLTADGFRPTELNTRMPAGLNTVGSIDLRLLALLQVNLLAGLDTGLAVADVESLLPLLDEHRDGHPTAVVDGRSVGPHQELSVAFAGEGDGLRLVRTDGDTGSRLVLADTTTGFFARVSPCDALRPGARLAPLNVALMDFLDREYDAGLGPLEAAPDLRPSPA